MDPDHLDWLASLQFGFIELDCALIHGSSADVADRLTETTSPLILMDRLTRLDVNRLFTARSGRQFRLELTGGQIHSKVTDHSGEHKAEQAVPKRSVIGIGGGDHYTLYDPATDHLAFLNVDPSRAQSGRGFGEPNSGHSERACSILHGHAQQSSLSMKNGTTQHRPKKQPSGGTYLVLAARAAHLISIAILLILMVKTQRYNRCVDVQIDRAAINPQWLRSQAKRII